MIWNCSMFISLIYHYIYHFISANVDISAWTNPHTIPNLVLPEFQHNQTSNFSNLWSNFGTKLKLWKTELSNACQTASLTELNCSQTLQKTKLHTSNPVYEIPMYIALLFCKCICISYDSRMQVKNKKIGTILLHTWKFRKVHRTSRLNSSNLQLWPPDRTKSNQSPTKRLNYKPGSFHHCLICFSLRFISNK